MSDDGLITAVEHEHTRLLLGFDLDDWVDRDRARLRLAWACEQAEARLRAPCPAEGAPALCVRLVAVYTAGLAVRSAGGDPPGEDEVRHGADIVTRWVRAMIPNMEV
jgi:hypothetical protein